jgi:hypothetical protein
MADVQSPVFNWELCADLHNRILDIGWAAVCEETGCDDEDSWWEHYFREESDEESEEDCDDEKKKQLPQAAELEELQRRLHPDVIHFLKTAKHDYPGTADSCYFFYYLKELGSPQSMLQTLNNEEITGLYMTQRLSLGTQSESLKDRYVWLYHIVGWVPGGLL